MNDVKDIKIISEEIIKINKKIVKIEQQMMKLTDKMSDILWQLKYNQLNK